MQVAAGICGTSASHWDPVEVVLTIQVNSQDVFFGELNLPEVGMGAKLVGGQIRIGRKCLFHHQPGELIEFFKSFWIFEPCALEFSA